MLSIPLCYGKFVIYSSITFKTKHILKILITGYRYIYIYLTDTYTIKQFTVIRILTTCCALTVIKENITNKM
jgi:hypothetical protein